MKGKDLIRLIVNADDFGLTESVSEGIIKSFGKGIVRSASVIVNTPAFEYSIELLKQNPGLDAGIHLVFVGEDSALTGVIDGLTKNDGTFYLNWKRVLFNLALRSLNMEKAEKEARAQIERLLKNGVTPSHIDSHQHLHLLPHFSRMVLKLAKEYRIRYVRCPTSSSKRYFGMNYLSRELKKLLVANGFPEPPEFRGFECRGRFNTKELRRIIENLKPGTYELMVHPGIENNALRQKYRWGYKWEEELSALTDPEVNDLLARNNLKLISFRELMEK